jgi:hypothetical protein
MLEKFRGRWTLLCANEMLSSSEDSGAQPTDCRCPQGTCQGEFIQAGTGGGRVISADASMRKSVKLAET